MSEIKNTADLRKLLLDVISDVRAGKCDAKDALAISALRTRVLQSAKLDFDVAKSNTHEVPSVPLLAEDKSPGEAKAPSRAGALK